MQRRGFLRLGTVALSLAIARAKPAAAAAQDMEIMTVRGPRRAAELGRVLPHEHVLVDFIGAAEISGNRYDRDAVFAKVRPYVERARALGCATMFECTPAYLGRDVRLLVRLSEATGVHFVTNTGYYAARQHKFVPAHALGEDAAALADRWSREWREGIDGTDVRPGFIKLGFDAGPLSELGRKLVNAAAVAHRATGLTIAAHTGDEVAAREQLAILGEHRVRPQAWIWVHAQNAKTEAARRAIAETGAWLSFDGVAPAMIPRYVQFLSEMKRGGHWPQVLVSHDAGWYRPGEPDGGRFRDYDAVFRLLLPALERAGFAEAELGQLTIDNPARAFGVRKRVG